MNQKKKSNPDNGSERPSRKLEDENPDKRVPNLDDTNDETEPPSKKMPITGGFHHPHHEEILDTTPD